MISKMIQTVLAAALVFSLPTLVQAEMKDSHDYTEVSYDDLLNELSAKKTHAVKDSKSPFDDVMIHAGLGYISSFANFQANNESMSRFETGLQLSLGIDLFSPSWYSEGVFRNYGVSNDGNESINLKEFDLKVGYKAPISNLWSYTVGTGLSNRFLTITDPTRDIDVNSTTPSLMISSGFYANPSKNIAIGVEGNAHAALISRTADKGSFDFALRVITSL
jgi:hypothetical protein